MMKHQEISRIHRSSKKKKKTPLQYWGPSSQVPPLEGDQVITVGGNSSFPVSSSPRSYLILFSQLLGSISINSFRSHSHLRLLTSHLLLHLLPAPFLSLHLFSNQLFLFCLLQSCAAPSKGAVFIIDLVSSLGLGPAF